MKSKSLEELTLLEARSMALGMLETQLNKHNLPLPKDSALDAHLERILLADPRITTWARERVLAKQDSYSESLKAIGLGTPNDDPIEAMDLGI